MVVAPASSAKHGLGSCRRRHHDHLVVTAQFRVVHRDDLVRGQPEVRGIGPQAPAQVDVTQEQMEVLGLDRLEELEPHARVSRRLFQRHAARLAHLSSAGPTLTVVRCKEPPGRIAGILSDDRGDGAREAETPSSHREKT